MAPFPTVVYCMPRWIPVEGRDDVMQLPPIEEFTLPQLFCAGYMCLIGNLCNNVKGRHVWHWVYMDGGKVCEPICLRKLYYAEYINGTEIA